MKIKIKDKNYNDAVIDTATATLPELNERNKKMKITREKLRLWGACYDDAKIAALVPEAGLTPLEVAALDIPAEDRLWVLLREDIIPARELRLLACGWAEAACLKTGWNDARSLAAIAVARRFAIGEATKSELNAAGKAAWAASRAAESATFAAASRAAESAAWSASRAAESAAWSASRAAESAAWAAVQAACSAADLSAAVQAWAAAEAKAAEQLADVVKVLKQIDEAGKDGGK